jgi:hypothetical protein
MKIRSVGAELFHANGQTDMTKLIVAFRDFANAPNTDIEIKCEAIDCIDMGPNMGRFRNLVNKQHIF